MNIFKLIPRTIIKKSFNLSVWTIGQFYDPAPYINKVEELRNLPEDTLGRDIVKCLDDNKLRFVPGYESHDLKHVLLNFKMTPVDEIRMQAFMLGNGNYTIPCFIILLFGALLLPAQWFVLYKDFLRGRNALPMSAFTVDEYANCKTTELRNQVFAPLHQKQSAITVQILTKYGALASIIAGVIGMMFCLPFLFSSSMADIVGAGFPFVGGAILAAGGLLALSNITKPQTHKMYA